MVVSRPLHPIYGGTTIQSVHIFHRFSSQLHHVTPAVMQGKAVRRLINQPMEENKDLIK